MLEGQLLADVRDPADNPIVAVAGLCAQATEIWFAFMINAVVVARN